MAKLTLQQLLAQAKKRQASRRKSARKTKRLQERLPEGEGSDLLSFAMNVAGDTRLTDAAQYAFTNRLLDEMVIRQLRNAPAPPPPSRTRSQPTQVILPPFTPTIPGPTEDGGFFTPEQAAEWDRKRLASPAIARKRRSDKQMMNDSIQSNALSAINQRARKKDGTFKKGWDQRRVMAAAQKECTKERERLGLCKRKSTRKGQRRKTARRAYKK